MTHPDDSLCAEFEHPQSFNDMLRLCDRDRTRIKMLGSDPQAVRVAIDRLVALCNHPMAVTLSDRERGIIALRLLEAQTMLAKEPPS